MKGKFTLLLALTLGICMNAMAQTQKEVSTFSGQEGTPKVRLVAPSIKRFAIEGSVGLINGNSPSTKLKPLVGELGIRYSFSDAFSAKIASEFGKFDYENSNSNFYNVTVQGYVNVLQLTGSSMTKSKFNLYLLGGLGVYQNNITPEFEGVKADKIKDAGINALGGIQISYKVTESVAINLSAKQTFLALGNRNLDGSKFNGSQRSPQNHYQTVSLGLSYYLGGKKSGKNAKHADWTRREFISKDMLVQALADYDKQQKNDEAEAIRKVKEEVEKNTASKADIQQAVASIAKQTDQKIAQGQTNGNANKQIQELIDKKYLMVFFPIGKSVPDNDAAFAINFVYTYLKNNPSKSVKVIGHTDNSGNAAVNQRLSEKRAKYVFDQLVNMGIPKGRLNLEGKGKNASHIENNSKASKSINRRVEFIIE